MDGVIFDTNILLSENFPRVSAAFKQLTEIARILKMDLLIPQIVLKELEQDFSSKCHEAIKTLEASLSKLRKYTELKTELSLPGIEDIINDYRKRTEDTVNGYGIKKLKFL